MAISQTEEKFVKYRHYLQSEVSRLGSYVALFRRLYERRTDRHEEMNIAPAFFQVAYDALDSAIILWVDKLFDENSERGIFNFLVFIDNNRDLVAIQELKRRIAEDHEPNDNWMRNREPITHKTINEDRERIRSLDCLQSFRTRRDKFYAHFDKDFFFDRERLENEAPLAWKDLEQPINLAGDIINRYSIAYDGREFSMVPSNINDVDHLLDCLHEYRARKLE